jgi:predicted kinase
MKKPTLITTLGFPGSGKTYLAEHLSKKLGFFHINADKVRHTVFEKPTFTPEETNGVIRLMNILTEDLLKKGISVMYDKNMNFVTERKVVQKIAKKHNVHYHVVWVQTDVPVAEKRLVKRSSNSAKKKNLLYPPLAVEILHKLKGQLEKPTRSEPVIVIDGHLPFAKQYAVLKKNLKLK